MSKKKAIICDLDGTLCNDDIRKEHVKDIVGTGKWGEHEYNRYYELMHTDTVFEHIKEIIYRFQTDHDIIFLTGRPERFREKTKNWIKEHLPDLKDGGLIMRPDGNYDHDIEIKKKEYREAIEPFYDVTFVLEDRTRVVQMWREIGLFCLQVQQSDF